MAQLQFQQEIRKTSNPRLFGTTAPTASNMPLRGNDLNEVIANTVDKKVADPAARKSLSNMITNLAGELNVLPTVDFVQGLTDFIAKQGVPANVQLKPQPGMGFEPSK